MKNETQTPPITTPNPSEYIYNSSSPPLMHRRTSVASSLSWDSGCDESLPSTPEGTLGDYSTAPIQLSYTDSLMMDEDDNDDVYPSNGSAIPHGIAVAPKLLSLPEYPQCQPPIPHHDNHHPHHQQHHHTAHQNPIDHYRHHHQQLQQLKQQQQQEEQQQRQQLQQRQKQQQQQQQQQQHDPSSMDMEMDIKMRSRSECEEPLQLQHPQYRKSNSLDSGLDYSRHRYPGFNDSVEMSDSPQSLVYSPDRYHPPSPEYQTHLHPTPTTPTTTAMLDYPATNCGDAALSALHLCYYAASPLMPMQYHQIQRRKPTSPTKKTKGTGLGRLPVVVSNNDKPHVCSIGTCNARFKRQEHLRRHERTHTDERPFDCDICGRKFSRTDNLRMHRKTHMKKTGRNLFVPGLE